MAVTLKLVQLVNGVPWGGVPVCPRLLLKDGEALELRDGFVFARDKRREMRIPLTNVAFMEDAPKCKDCDAVAVFDASKPCRDCAEINEQLSREHPAPAAAPPKDDTIRMVKKNGRIVNADDV